ncbi:VC0807 family protein [Amycolatopsis rifamycinica]|uniref:VC0807 family protein n=1 Tax=Amycolatopsis rifamycinica TaxID=287986 RepID=UPI001269CF43|nr:VC0807 family protein [Amycolatopsis rifamycinica]
MSRGSSLPRVGKVVLVDVGLPYAVYLALSRLGVSPVLALVVAGGVSLVRVAVGYVAERTVSALSVLVLVRFGLGVLLGLLSGDARVVLIKDSLVTASVGLAALVSLFLARPLTYYIRRDFNGDRNAGEESWTHSTEFRRTNRVTTGAWTAGLLAESAARIGVAFWTPLDIATLACPAIGACSILVLIAWTQWYGHAARPTVDAELAAVRS